MVTYQDTEHSCSGSRVLLFPLLAQISFKIVFFLPIRIKQTNKKNLFQLNRFILFFFFSFGRNTNLKNPLSTQLLLCLNLEILFFF